MSEKTNPYNWIDRDGRKRLFQEFKLLSESRWRDRIKVKPCLIKEYRENLAIEAAISGSRMFYVVQVVYPWNYPETAPKVFIDQSVMSGSEHLIFQHRSENCFFNPDGSLRLKLPTGDVISTVLVLDRAEEWFVRYKRHEKIYHLEV